MMTTVLFLVLACGSERWPVKTMTDSGAVHVYIHAPQRALVRHLVYLQAPAYAEENPRAPEELVVWEVEALVIGFKLETDLDYHVVIADQQDPSLTMIVELPDPACAKGSVVGSQIVQARRQFLRYFQAPKKKYARLKAPKLMRFHGVGFFDKLHGQTGVARNGFELHPILSVEPAPAAVR